MRKFLFATSSLTLGLTLLAANIAKSKGLENAYSPAAELSVKYSRDRKIGELNYMQPLWSSVNADDLVILDTKLKMDNKKSQEINLGLVYRHAIGDNLILGGYGYFDHREDNKFKVDGGTFGIEALSKYIDARANIYIPKQKRKKIEHNDKRKIQMYNTKLSVIRYGDTYQHALTGYDIEIGGPIFMFSESINEKLGTKLFLAHYDFRNKDTKKIIGNRLRLEQPFGSVKLGDYALQFTLSAETQYDKVRGRQNFVGIGGKIDFNKGKKTPRKSRMMQTVIRDVDIVFSGKEKESDIEHGVFDQHGKLVSSLSYLDASITDQDYRGNGTEKMPYSLYQLSKLSDSTRFIVINTEKATPKNMRRLDRLGSAIVNNGNPTHIHLRTPDGEIVGTISSLHSKHVTITGSGGHVAIGAADHHSDKPLTLLTHDAEAPVKTDIPNIPAPPIREIPIMPVVDMLPFAHEGEHVIEEHVAAPAFVVEEEEHEDIDIDVAAFFERLEEAEEEELPPLEDVAEREILPLVDIRDLPLPMFEAEEEEVHLEVREAEAAEELAGGIIPPEALELPLEIPEVARVAEREVEEHVVEERVIVPVVARVAEREVEEHVVEERVIVPVVVPEAAEHEDIDMGIAGLFERAEAIGEERVVPVALPLLMAPALIPVETAIARAARLRLEREAAEARLREEAERVERERVEAEEARRLEEARLEREERERIERERLAELAREEEARLEREEREREETERLAREREERERLLAEEVRRLEEARLERERIEREAAEAHRLEEARRVEEEARAREEAATRLRLEREERDRERLAELAREEEARLEEERRTREEEARLEREEREREETERLEREARGREEAEARRGEEPAEEAEHEDIDMGIAGLFERAEAIGEERVVPVALPLLMAPALIPVETAIARAARLRLERERVAEARRLEEARLREEEIARLEREERERETAARLRLEEETRIREEREREEREAARLERERERVERERLAELAREEEARLEEERRTREEEARLREEEIARLEREERERERVERETAEARRVEEEVRAREEAAHLERENATRVLEAFMGRIDAMRTKEGIDTAYKHQVIGALTNAYNLANDAFRRESFADVTLHLQEGTEETNRLVGAEEIRVAALIEDNNREREEARLARERERTERERLAELERERLAELEREEARRLEEETRLHEEETRIRLEREREEREREEAVRINEEAERLEREAARLKREKLAEESHRLKEEAAEETEEEALLELSSLSKTSLGGSIAFSSISDPLIPTEKEELTITPMSASSVVLPKALETPITIEPKEAAPEPLDSIVIPKIETLEELVEEVEDEDAAYRETVERREAEERTKRRNEAHTEVVNSEHRDEVDLDLEKDSEEEIEDISEINEEEIEIVLSESEGEESPYGLTPNHVAPQATGTTKKAKAKPKQVKEEEALKKTEQTKKKITAEKKEKREVTTKKIHNNKELKEQEKQVQNKAKLADKEKKEAISALSKARQKVKELEEKQKKAQEAVDNAKAKGTKKKKQQELSNLNQQLKSAKKDLSDVTKELKKKGLITTTTKKEGTVSPKSAFVPSKEPEKNIATDEARINKEEQERSE